MASSTRASSHNSEESDTSTPRSSPSPELEKATISSSSVARKTIVTKNQSDQSISDQTPTRFLARCSKLDLEPNPFEQSFSHIATSESGETSSPKPSLPPVTALTSPSPGIPANQQYGWNYSSLRSGTLSPSMLEGPQNPIVFDDLQPAGRTGTTPLPFNPYPEPSPRTAALFSNASLPGTFPPANPSANPSLIVSSTISGAQKNTQSVTAQSQASAPAAPSGGTIGLSGVIMPASHNSQRDPVKTEPESNANDSPNKKRNNSKPSNGSITNRTKRGMSITSVTSVNSIDSDESTADEELDERLNNDRSGNTQKSANRGTRRKGDDNSNDQPSAKKTSSKNKSDLTDEEKRRNFLERNRQAALKCRQRKKQWLANLQAKVEYLTNDNEQLQNQATSLREEILNLKTLLLAHKDCPIAQANGVVLDGLPPTAGMAGPMAGMNVAPNSVPMGINVGMMQGPGPGAPMQGSMPANAIQQQIPMTQVQMPPHMTNVNGAPPGSGVLRY